MSSSEQSRRVLIPADAHDRVASSLAALPHTVELFLWSPDGITTVDGSPVVGEVARPEAAWLDLNVLTQGRLGAMVDDLVATGSVRWVQGMLAGVDAPPFKVIQDAGIRLSNSDAPNIGVAEYVMSSLLAVVHGVGDRIETAKDRKWRQKRWTEIGGMRWLIVGFGSIGGEVAKRARPFGVEVVGIRRTEVTDERANRMATMDSLHAELAEADAVIMACPLTDETRGLADASFFTAMKPGSILVNVARGAIVDNKALLAALDGGVPSMAILDVFETEPLPETDPLWDHPGVFVTSHVAGAGAGIGPRGDQLFVEQLDDYLADRPLRLEV